MNEQPVHAPRFYPVDVKQNRAEWYKATLPCLPVLVGIGASEEEARTNLEQELYKELERRIRSFSAMPDLVEVRGVNGHAVEFPQGVAERIEFVNLMAKNKIFLEELADASEMLDKHVRSVFSINPLQSSEQGSLLMVKLKACGLELLRQRTRHGC